MLIVTLTAKATAMTMAMATATSMIYHHLFYDSNKTIVAIILKMVGGFVDDEGNGRSERKRLFLFLQLQ
jgi:hypothetical protein